MTISNARHFNESGMILETVWISAGPLCLKDDSGIWACILPEKIFSLANSTILQGKWTSLAVWRYFVQ